MATEPRHVVRCARRLKAKRIALPSPNGARAAVARLAPRRPAPGPQRWSLDAILAQNSVYGNTGELPIFGRWPDIYWLLLYMLPDATGRTAALIPISLWYAMRTALWKILWRSAVAGTVIQVPIDHSLRAALDRLARERSTSRAEIIRQACLHYIREQAERSDEARYVEGYRRRPEEPALADAQAALAAAVLADERW